MCNGSVTIWATKNSPCYIPLYSLVNRESLQWHIVIPTTTGIIILYISQKQPGYFVFTAHFVVRCFHILRFERKLRAARYCRRSHLILYLHFYQRPCCLVFLARNERSRWGICIGCWDENGNMCEDLKINKVPNLAKSSTFFLSGNVWFKKP